MGSVHLEHSGSGRSRGQRGGDVVSGLGERLDRGQGGRRRETRCPRVIRTGGLIGRGPSGLGQGRTGAAGGAQVAAVPEERLGEGHSVMPEGQGAPAALLAAPSDSERGLSWPAAPPPSPFLAPGSPAPRRGAVRASFPQKLAEALSSQYALNVFVAGLLFLLAWAVHASGVGKRDLLCFLTALMLLQLLWMAWYVRRSAAHRRLIRPKDAYAGARWLRGESPTPPTGGRARERTAKPACSPATCRHAVSPHHRPLPPPSFSLFCLRLPVHLSAPPTRNLHFFSLSLRLQALALYSDVGTTVTQTYSHLSFLV